MSERHRGQQAESNTAVAEEAPSVRERYQALKLAHQLNVQYARDLQAKEQTAVLTAAEVDELTRTERMIDNQATILAQVEGELQRELERVDVEAVAERWTGRIPALQSAYDKRAMLIAALAAVHAEIDAIHTASVADLAAMPRAFQDRVGIPDPAILRQWMASSLPAEVSPVVFVRALTQGEHARALDVDPCLKPLSPRALRNYLERR